MNLINFVTYLFDENWFSQCLGVEKCRYCSCTNYLGQEVVPCEASSPFLGFGVYIYDVVVTYFVHSRYFLKL